MLSYNIPEELAKRENVESPSAYDMQLIVEGLNEVIGLIPEHKRGNLPQLLQILLDDHLNKTHFFDVAGGWEGLTNSNEWFKIEDTFPQIVDRPKQEKDGVSVQVMVYLNGYIQTGRYSYNNEKWVIAGFDEYQNPSHWRYLPEPPVIE